MFCILTIFILLVHMKRITSQYYEGMPQQYYQNIPMQYYDQRVNNAPLEYLDEYSQALRSNRYGSNYDYMNQNQQECVCACDQCKQPKPCCYFSCFSCSPTAPMSPSPALSIAPTNTNQNHLVFVPYPYPLTIPIPNPVSNVSLLTGTLTTTRTTTTTTTTKPTTTSNRNAPYITKLCAGDECDTLRKYQPQMYEEEDDIPYLTQHRKSIVLNPIQRKIRPAWVPKYGIVPIPDQLAAKLMSQLRGVRAMQDKRL